METLVSQFTSLIVSALIVEAVVHALFSFQPLKEFDKKIAWFPMTVATAMVIGAVVCYKVQLDILAIAFTVEPSVIGFLFSGLLVSRGSNYLHDLVKKITNAGKDITSR